MVLLRATPAIRAADQPGAAVAGSTKTRLAPTPGSNEPMAAGEAMAGLRAQPLAPRSQPTGTTMFTEMRPEQTGIVTENRYADPRMWGDRYYEYQVGEIATGVAIGDYDGDGRPDLFVVSKTESCRLFRNLGGFKFVDVTEHAGVGDQGAAALVWKQGATFADINNDGRLDIYVCRYRAPNLLYINQGDGTFKEEAHAYGLDVNDASVMAMFCDYDRDGWLDVFVQTNMLDANQHPNGQRNYLFHNEHNGTFANVTAAAGIGGEGQGHSATWWDYDEDGWPDLYVGNDFRAPDKLYHNNRDGTFTNVIGQVVPHTPYSSMGSDLGDINNDGHIDFFISDMAATTHEKDHRGMAESRAQTTDAIAEPGSAPQYERNALYVNTGTGRCLEAAYLAGIAATDWTWAPRFEDLDNDGRLDLVVTNGMDREATSIDLMARRMGAQTAAERIRVVRDSPLLAEANLAFRNLGDLQFANVSAQWGLNERGVSFGSALGDLDGDGDLDIVYANYQKGVTVLRNDGQTGHRLILELRGAGANRFGIGATVQIESALGRQIRQLVLARGVLSSSEPILHFGLGDDSVVNRLAVTWPSGRVQSFENVAADQRLTITEPDPPLERAKLVDAPPARPQAAEPLPARSASLPVHFTETGRMAGLALLSREEPIDETAVQRLLPMRLNQRGPSIAVGDVNGDGVDDVVIGGTTATPLHLLLASPAGRFTPSEDSRVFPPDVVDDGPILLFDAEGNGTNALLVTKGGTRLPAGAPEYQPKLFFNDAHGVFRAAPADTLPSLPISTGAVATADFDRDGRLDLFIGGRVLPGQYPLPPRSALLVNRGGRFEDVTDEQAPGLREIGMVTAALWSDVDGDGWPDLVLTLEWGAVKCLHNLAGKGFEDWSERIGFTSAGLGWWSSLGAADFNGDGRPDFVVGNLGLNTQYRADPQHPALLFVSDFKGQGEEPQVVEAYYENNRLLPRRSRRELGAAIPAVLKRFPTNNGYARATLGEILGNGPLANAQRFAATELRSGVLMSQPGGSYRFEPLPRLAQISPLQGIVAGDLDGDGHADIYAAQNSYAPVPAIGRFDGGLSQLLYGDGRGNFRPVPTNETNLVVPGDAKAVVAGDFNGDGWPDLLVSRNDDTSLAFTNNGAKGRHPLRIALRAPAGNPLAIGARVVLELANGSREAAEIHGGSSYYSQSVAACFFGYSDQNPPRKVHVRWPSGASTDHDVPAGAATLTLRAP
jgi:hypothetical protein